MDPMTMAAIGGAVDSLFSGVTSIIVSAEQRKIAYQQWLANSAPKYTDIFAPYKTQESNTNVIIIVIIALLIIVVLAAIVFKK